MESGFAVNFALIYFIMYLHQIETLVLSMKRLEFRLWKSFLIKMIQGARVIMKRKYKK